MWTFTRIAELKATYEAQGNPVVSVDTKKKEHIGQMFRECALYTTETIEVLDHDFPSLADGVAIPHAVYTLPSAGTSDIACNEAYVSIDTSHDTAEFACDSIRYGWTNLKIAYFKWEMCPLFWKLQF